MQSESTSSQDKILYQIKRRGPLTARLLAETLGMTAMGIRQHLSQLEAEGLVRNLPEQAVSRGRPVRPWDLTSLGHGRFPDAHAQTTVELIASVRDVLGEAALDQLIDHKTARWAATYAAKMAGKKTLEAKADCLAELRTNEGYMARLEQDGPDFLLIEDHCPICVAAESCQGFCRRELEIFESLFSGIATVTREEHLLSGARRCSYRIRPAMATGLASNQSDIT